MTEQRKELAKLAKFFAIVGPEGAGKTTLLKGLADSLDSRFVDFLCDSSTLCNAEHTRFTERVTQISKDGLHKHTTPRSQVAFFWSRLEPIICNSVRPALDAQKTVIIDGFGGTILANARLNARNDAERASLLKMHKNLIESCVLDHGVPPPLYLWLKPDPVIAYGRVRAMREQAIIEAKSVAERAQREAEWREVTIDRVRRLNEELEFYGTIPGQRLIEIDANQRAETVLEIALEKIRERLEAAQHAAVAL